MFTIRINYYAGHCIGALAWMLAALLLIQISDARAETKPPNFVIIMADDMGYADTSSYGNKAYQMPALIHLEDDPGEKNDLATAQSQRVDSMLADLEAWYVNVLDGATQQPEAP